MLLEVFGEHHINNYSDFLYSAEEYKLQRNIFIIYFIFLFIGILKSLFYCVFFLESTLFEFSSFQNFFLSLVTFDVFCSSFLC